jgi:hypothetical protein
MDGQVMENDVFIFPNGKTTPGPKRSGVAAQDINCRCRVVAETEGYTPTVRRIRDEGVQPYKTFRQWAQERGLLANQYGQKYDFLNG